MGTWMRHGYKGVTYTAGDVLRMKSENELVSFEGGAIFPDATILYFRSEKDITYIGLARARALLNEHTAIGANHLAITPLLTYERYEITESHLEGFLHYKRTR